MRTIQRRGTKEIKDTPQKHALSDAFIIAAASGLAYALAFTYELGYARYFSIPAEFISLNTWTVVLLMVTIPAVVAPALWIINLAHPFATIFISSRHPLARALVPPAIMLLLLAGLALTLASQRRLFLSLAITILLFAAVILTGALIFSRSQGGYSTKLGIWRRASSPAS